MNLPAPIRVLIAEDVRTDAELSARELKRAGLQVEHRIVQDEEAFRRALAEFAPEVILCDFSMPQFDGMAALRLACELAPDVPFIFVSGTMGEEYAVRALKSGATDYVLKGNLLRLPPAVERALAEARERKAKRAADEALRESEAHLRGILESAPDGIAVYDREGRLVTANPQFAAIFGYAAEELLGRDVGILIPAELREQHAGHLAGFIQAPRARRMARGVPLEGLRKGGTRINLEVGLSPFHATGGLHVTCIVRDVTEQVAQRRRIERLSRNRYLLGAVNAAIVRIRDRQALFVEFFRIAVLRGGFVHARVVEFEKNGKARVAATTETDPARFQKVVDAYNRNPEAMDTLFAQAARTRQALISNDVARDERVVNRAARIDQGRYALALLPMVAEERLAGMVVLRAREPGFFDDEELRLVGELAGNLSFALELMDKQTHLDYLAFYDPLTGLANRRRFRDRLAQAIEASGEGKSRLALVFLDIERFEAVNDAFGDAAADRLLKKVARRTVETAGDRDRVGRIIGDQFAFYLPSVRNADEVGRTLEAAAPRLLDAMHELDSRELRVAAKAGIAMFPEDGKDADRLMRNAEAALHKAKATGERTLFYGPQINARVAERLDLEAKLRGAAERGEFLLHFQPLVELPTNRISGAEALLRWRSGEAGFMPPVKFVPVLEDTGLIQRVGLWAMREAVATHHAWAGRGLAAPRIAVNVSAIQLRSRGFVDEVREALGGAGEIAGLDLEITESLLMEDIDESLKKLSSVRDLGVRIALDDFGTGYSSLAYLSRLPINTLKIDRSFIRNVAEKAEDTSIVSAMISLARSLRLKIVAEGVETEEQARLLRLLGCDQMQGYLFSPPLPADELEPLLRGQPA